ncbi:hypothetical protein [Niabella hibiscisoli]|uniref:hypothetical protein n=1 Tax=Niabella hibiscisoli TaxID=1825928 RepID=UPI001F115131|nr:hypothetical protein [Niabella hibiscisoli]MCH5718944.1 hypothetical protein [Niabella hibiscisoli]
MISRCIMVMIVVLSSLAGKINAQQLIANVYGRNVQSLNGKWDAIIDLYDQGRKNKIYLNKKPEGKTDFYEYSLKMVSGSTYRQTGTASCRNSSIMKVRFGMQGALMLLKYPGSDCFYTLVQ